MYYHFNLGIDSIWDILLQLRDSTLYLGCSLLYITPSTLGCNLHLLRVFLALYYSLNFWILQCMWVILCSVLPLNYVIIHCIRVVLCSVLLLQLWDSTLHLGCSLLSITPSTLGFYIVSGLFFAEYYFFYYVILQCI